MTPQSLFPQISAIIADVLMLDASEIQLNSRLIDDLGAESIDFLDLAFQLEKTFNIRIPRGQIERNARGTLTEEEFEKGGILTPQGLAALKAYLNEVPESAFKPNLKLSEIPLLFTVETFCKIVMAALYEKQTADTVA